MHRQLFRKLLISSGLALGVGVQMVGELYAQESVGSVVAAEGLCSHRRRIA